MAVVSGAPQMWLVARLPDTHAETSNVRIFFRHSVCREDSQSLVLACVEHTVALLQRSLPDALWQVELVCDEPLPWTPPAVVRRIQVPDSYSTINSTPGHARMLHYASLHSGAAEADWVVHLAAGTALRERTVCTERTVSRAVSPSRTGGCHCSARRR
jgi:hypothetical protein